MKHQINIKKSPLDIRDYQATHFIDNSIELPESYISSKTKVRCQWLSSQCVAFACTQSMSQQEAMMGKYNIYSNGYLYATREMTDYQDDGWYIRQCLKNLQKFGTVLYKDFPHNHDYARELIHVAHFDLANNIERYKIKTYFKCNTIDEIKKCIIQNGSVITGCSIYGYDWFIKSNISKKQLKKKELGGHAFIIIGWTKDNKWICQDSYSIFRPFLGRFKIDMDFPLDEYWGIIR